MTVDTTAPAVDAYLAALNDEPRQRLRITRTVEYHLHTAFSRGWTPAQLADECNRNLDGAGNIGAVITDRLRIAATINPPKHAAAKQKVHHGCCENGFIYDETTDPPTVTRCAGPNAKETHT